jgi:hemerythrin
MQRETTMEVNLEWSTDYVIGLEEIDVQHRRILSFIKQIYDLASQSVEDESVQKLLGELVRYMHFHFNSEELLMVVYEYPKAEEQKKQHAQLITDLERQYAKLETHQGSMVQLLFMLVKWFVTHDNDFDKEFGHYVAEVRER